MTRGTHAYPISVFLLATDSAMSLKNAIRYLALLFIGLSSTVQAGDSLSSDTSTDITGDELLFMDIPTVVTASRRAEPVSRAPMQVTVITADDIRMSGATTIPDVLRLVPGIEVVTLGVRNQSVKIRESSVDPYSSKLLVMIDNRTVFWDAYGTVRWEMLPVSLNEIERIELVRGPGSSLYGSNAVNGVVHIITKRPDEIDGTAVSVTTGEQGTIRGSAKFGAAGERLSGKISAEVDLVDQWGGGDVPAGRIDRLNGLIEYRWGDGLSLNLSGGLSHCDDTRFYAGRELRNIGTSGEEAYGQLDLLLHDAAITTFVKSDDFDLNLLALEHTIRYRTLLWNIDAQRPFELAEWFTLLVGANYRVTRFYDNRYVAEGHTHHIVGLFLDNELLRGDIVQLRLGGRYDWHPITGSRFSPRGALVLTPADNQVVRLSAGTAYRNPTYLDSYLELEFDAFIDAQERIVFDTSDAPSAFALPVTLELCGNDNLGPTTQRSAEARYSGRFLKRLDADIAAYTKYVTGLYTDSVHVQSWDTTTNRMRVRQDKVMGDDAFGFGGEAAVRARLTEWLELRGGYSYQRHWHIEHDTLWTLQRASPAHKVNLGARIEHRGLWFSVDCLWRDDTRWEWSNETARVPGYWLVNASAGYRREVMSVSAGVFDLFDRQHYEFPPRYADRLHQRLTVTVSCLF